MAQSAHGERTPRVLSIAGSDSGGGAGIQADLKAFAACGVHGMSAITAITAQHTRAVEAVAHVDPGMIVAQVRAVVEDIGVDAVKIGMLGTAATIEAVATALDLLPSAVPVVLDPVMVAESGAALLDPAARQVMIDRLFARATVITPNLPESRTLAAAPEASAEALLDTLWRLGPDVVVLTGGHREVATDLYFDGTTVHAIPGERHPDGAAHGSGCTHSSVLAARLALGDPPLQAARTARRMAGEAVRHGLRDVGEGPGPVDVLGLANIRRTTRPGISA